LPSKIGGIPVGYSFYDNQKREVQRLERILTQLNEKRIPATEITILSPVVFEHSCVAQIDRQKFRIRSIPENVSSSKKDSHSINFCTIHGFKGLESPYVILTDIVKMNDDEFRSLLYVGMSRAKIGLSVLIHKQSEKYYNTLIQRRIVAK
jgi:superfamily I DNA/RNA helicase